MQVSEGISTLNRDNLFREIATTSYDVLIIGGGIMGAGIALDAAARNLKVLLVEKQDFAAGTSSRSTKLIHGGLRYLKNLEFGLVREVASERKILHRNAPHLVVPEPMLLPVFKNSGYGYFATAAGLMLYDWLGNVEKPERNRMLRRAATLQQEPLLDPENLKGAGRFYEYRTDDARLTLEVLKTACQYGAMCLNYTDFTSFAYNSDNKLTGGTLQDELTGNSIPVKARCLINASGPWSFQLMEQDQPQKGSRLYHTKGIHLVVPRRRFPLKQSVYFDIPGGRMLFAIPRNNVTYLGTTDTPFTENLENPTITSEDAAYVLNEINRMFPSLNLKPEEVTSGWAGVRALLFEAGKKPSQISRKDEIFVSASGLITVAGGKLTGYRLLAEKVVDKMLKLNFPGINQKSGTRNLKLSGGNFENPEGVTAFLNGCLTEAINQGFSPERIPFLVQTYGTNATEILQKAVQLKSKNKNAEDAMLQAEIWYTITAEGATSIADFLIRRTGRLYFERDFIPGILPEVSRGFQEMLHWNEEKTRKAQLEFQHLYEAAVAFKKKL